MSPFERGYSVSDYLVKHLSRAVQQHRANENQFHQQRKGAQLPPVHNLCTTLNRLLYVQPASLPKLSQSSRHDFFQLLVAKHKDLAEEDEFLRVSAEKKSPIYTWVQRKELARAGIVMSFARPTDLSFEVKALPEPLTRWKLGSLVWGQWSCYCTTMSAHSSAEALIECGGSSKRLPSTLLFSRNGFLTVPRFFPS
jgi:hypothetical protein